MSLRPIHRISKRDSCRKDSEDSKTHKLGRNSQVHMAGKTLLGKSELFKKFVKLILLPTLGKFEVFDL